MKIIKSVFLNLIGKTPDRPKQSIKFNSMEELYKYLDMLTFEEWNRFYYCVNPYFVDEDLKTYE